MDAGTIAVIVAAALAVLATGLLKFDWLSKTVKQVIALVVSIVGGVVTALVTGDLTSATSVLETVVVVYGLQQGIYQFVFDDGKPLNFVDNALESALRREPPAPEDEDE
jgi:uncharacterized protein (DUF697 family)